MSKNGEGKPLHNLPVSKNIMTMNLRRCTKFYLVSKPQALIHCQLTEDSFSLRLNTDIIQAERTPGYLTVKQNSIRPLCVLRIKQN